MNRTFRLVRLGLFVATASIGCSSIFEPSGGINVRVANDSSFPFTRVEVVFPDDAVDYGAVPARDVSDYRRVSTAYRYAYIEVEVGGEKLKIQPIDYVGEEELEPGRYTYALNVTIEGYLTLAFREDR